MDDSQFSTHLPTIQTADGTVITYDARHLQEFFIKDVSQNILNLTDEEKDAWFRFQRDNADLLQKLVRSEVSEAVMSHGYSLHSAAEIAAAETVDDELLKQYNEWLSKQPQ